MVPVAVAVQGGEHDAERAGPLAEEDEEVMAQALLGKQEASLVHWGANQTDLLLKLWMVTESGKLKIYTFHYASKL